MIETVEQREQRRDKNQVHPAINSRLDELIAATTTASIAIGRRQIETEQAEAARMPN